MSANVMRRAATEMRVTVRGVGGDPRLVSDHFKLATAALLDAIDGGANDVDTRDAALAVANAFLGETP